MAKFVIAVGIALLAGHAAVGQDFQTPDRCKQAADGGVCKGAFRRYAFNQARGDCVAFNYGGCRGNENNFEALDDCRLTCMGVRASTRRRIVARSSLD